MALDEMMEALFSVCIFNSYQAASGSCKHGLGKALGTLVSIIHQLLHPAQAGSLGTVQITGAQLRLRPRAATGHRGLRDLPCPPEPQFSPLPARLLREATRTPSGGSQEAPAPRLDQSQTEAQRSVCPQCPQGRRQVLSAEAQARRRVRGEPHGPQALCLSGSCDLVPVSSPDM